MRAMAFSFALPTISTVGTQQDIAIKRAFDTRVSDIFYERYLESLFNIEPQETPQMQLALELTVKYGFITGEYVEYSPALQGIRFFSYIDGRYIDEYDFITDEYTTLFVEARRK